MARELRSDRLVRQWLTDSVQSQPPFDVGPDSLFIAYYASAELGCCLSLGWPMPTRVLDLYVEFRCLTNGRTIPGGSGLLGALAFYGLDCMESAEKQTMRELAMRAGPYSPELADRIAGLLPNDVDALPKLFETDD